MGSLSRMTRISMFLAAAVCLVLLAGCGEKEEPATTGPVVQQTTTGSTGGTTTTAQQPVKTEQQLVSEAATNFLALPGADICDMGLTPTFLRSAYGDRAGCVAARKPASLATTTQISDVRLSGNSATLTATAKGGTYGNGQKLQMTVVRDTAGRWQVDEVKSDAPVGP